MKVQKSQTLEVSQMWMICICQIKVIFATMTSFYTTQLSKISFQIERDKITELNFNPIPKKVQIWNFYFCSFFCTERWSQVLILSQIFLTLNNLCNLRMWHLKKNTVTIRFTDHQIPKTLRSVSYFNSRMLKNYIL